MLSPGGDGGRLGQSDADRQTHLSRDCLLVHRIAWG